MAYITERDLSSMRGAFRLDAEFWLPVYETVEKAIASVDHVCLGDLASDVRKGIFYILASEYTESGIPFYRSSNVGEILMKETDLAFISAAKDGEEAKTSLRFGDIVLGKTGKEAAAIITVDRCNISQDVIGIRLSKGAINPFFLVTFLNSLPGIMQMRRWFQGQVQMHLTLPDARRVLVPALPNAFQSRVEATVRKALKRRAESADLYAQAEGLLLSELGLASLNLSRSLFYERDFSQTLQAARLDAEFYQPMYSALIRGLRATGKCCTLGSCCRYIGHGPQPPYVEDGRIPVLTQKQMGKQFLSFDSINCFTSVDYWCERASDQILLHDVLYYSVGAYLGRANLWLENTPAMTGSYVTTIRPDKRVCLPHYLCVFLNSPAGQMQSDRYSRASAQQYIYPRDLSEFSVVVPDLRIQHEISTYVVRAHAARHESRRLLDEAKQMVEEAVLHGTQ